MKILHVITSLQTGGAETLVVNLIPRLEALGHELGLVVFNGERTPLMQRLERECPECKIYCLGASFYNPCYIVKLMQIMRKYDVVHTHNSSPQLFAAIANLWCRKKLVTTEHSTNNRKREQGGILRIMDKWMYRRYDKVICISVIAKDSLEKYLLGKEPETSNINHITNRICTINNGVDVELFRNAQPIEELKTEKFVVVMVAGFREAKDQDTVIRAMAILPRGEYELWLVGDGTRKRELEQEAAGLQLQDSVRFLGLRMDVPQILKTADVVVMSSHWEGLSLSNIEGMSAGKPFVASDVNGLREVTDGYGILFQHENEKELADILLRLSKDQDYYQQVAKRCLARAKEYDIHQTVSQYHHIYLDVT